MSNASLDSLCDASLTRHPRRSLRPAWKQCRPASVHEKDGSSNSQRNVDDVEQAAPHLQEERCISAGTVFDRLEDQLNREGRSLRLEAYSPPAKAGAQWTMWLLATMVSAVIIGLTVAVAVLATAQRHVAVAVDEAAQSSLVGPTVHTVAPVAPVAAVAIPATPNTTFAAAAAAATDTDIDTATADITSATAPSRHNHVADEHQKPVAMCYYLLADALLPCSVVGGSPYAHPYNATAAAATTDAAPIMPTATATVTVTAAKAPTSSSEGIYPGVVPGPEFRPGFKDLAAVLPASAHPSADAAAAPVTTASPPADTASSLRASSLYLSWTTLGYYPDVHNSDPEPRPALAAQESNPEPRPARPAFDHKWGRVGIAVVRPSGPAGTRLMVDPTTASAASAASATQVAPSTTAASTTASRTVPMVTVTVWVTPTTTAA